MNDENLDYTQFEHLSVRDLAFRIKQVDDSIANPQTTEARKERKPRFALFLGAGASFQSGIKVAGEMMEDFKKRIFERECPELQDEDKNKWLEKQTWYCNSENKYSCLFNKYDDDRTARQRYIESLIKKGNPSFGYLVVSYLLVNNYINTVLTTNFDDLTYISCVTYTGVRPLIYAYGLLASEMRLSSSRPKIFKLHGDYLYSNLINTEEEMTKVSKDFQLATEYPDLINKLKELSIIDLNMSADVQRILSEYGLIVVGFEGNDKSIRGIFEQIPLGCELIWCYWKPKPPNQEVLKLINRKNGKLIAIDGFDEMMSDIEKVIPLKKEELIADIDAQKEKVLALIGRFRPDYIEGFVSNVVEESKSEPKDLEEQIHEDWLYVFYQALDAQNKGQRELAKQLYEKVIELNPDYAPAYNHLGLLLDKANYPQEEVAKLFNKAIELNPDYAYAYNNLGFLFAKDRTKLKEAEKYFREAIEIDSTYVEALSNLGFLLDRIGFHQKEAEELLKKAISFDPNYIEAYNNLGILLDRIDYRQKEAEEYFRKAIAIQPNTQTYNNLAVLLVRDNLRLEEAEECFRKAIESDPDNAFAHRGLGSLLFKDELRLKEAEDLLEKAINLNRNNAFANSTLGILISKDKSRYEEAEKYLKKAVEINPNNYSALYNLGLILSNDKSRCSEAIEYMNKVIENSPNNINAHYLLGILLYDDKQFCEAEKLLRKVVEKKPNNWNAHFYLSIVISKDKTRLSEAESFGREANKLNPDHLGINEFLSIIISKDKTRFAEAEEVLDRAIKLHPLNPQAFRNLAVFLKGNPSRFTDAENALRKSIDLAPEKAESYKELALLLSQQPERLEEAVKMYRKILEIKPNNRDFRNAFGVFLLRLASHHRKLSNQNLADKYAKESLSLINEDSPYNLARLHSILNNYGETIKYLEISLKKSPSKKQEAKNTSDFDWLRNDSRFKEIVAE